MDNFCTNKYIEVTIFPSPMHEEVTDVIAALLAPLGYDSFSTEADSLKAYCTADKFSSEALNSFVADFPLSDVSLSWSVNEVMTEDWNSEWENSVMFEPIIISDLCCIHSPHATDIPHCTHDIVIAPKMSFGSGHHETTRMLLEEILSLNSSDSNIKSALDMGTGTGILAILCGKLGMQVRAIEIDPWVAENAVDNVLYNNLAGKVHVECGDATLLSDKEKYDIILANINRNVLINDMHSYADSLNTNGILLMSGFYLDDLPMIINCAESLNMAYVSHRCENNWVAAKFLSGIRTGSL